MGLTPNLIGFSWQLAGRLCQAFLSEGSWSPRAVPHKGLGHVQGHCNLAPVGHSMAQPGSPTCSVWALAVGLGVTGGPLGRLDWGSCDGKVSVVGKQSKSKANAVLFLPGQSLPAGRVKTLPHVRCGVQLVNKTAGTHGSHEGMLAVCCALWPSLMTRDGHNSFDCHRQPEAKPEQAWQHMHERRLLLVWRPALASGTRYELCRQQGQIRLERGQGVTHLLQRIPK